MVGADVKGLGAIVLVCAAVTTAAAQGHDKKKASEHFALAEQAEKRKDYRRAIEEYERAYDAAPHPAMLYNIARNHERLGEPRAAAEHYRRYLDESEAPSDRNKVEGRIRDLRSRKSRLEVEATPAGAVVFIDDQERGAAPLALTIDAGEHEIYVAASGKTSQVRTITAEYGEPQTVRFDLSQRSGLLIVSCNVQGAEVRLDGELIGHTPFSGPVPAGEGQLVVTREGFQAAQRSVTVAPGGSQRVQMNLSRIPGTEPPEPEGPPPTASWLMGIGYGWDASGSSESASSSTGLRYAFNIGVRSASRRLEASLVLGTFGGGHGGIGLESRYYFSTSALRPYARAAAILAGDSSTPEDDRSVGVEGGGGILYSMEGRAYRIDYFLEVDVQAFFGGGDAMDVESDGTEIGVPVTLGIMYSFGGTARQQ